MKRLSSLKAEKFQDKQYILRTLVKDQGELSGSPIFMSTHDSHFNRGSHAALSGSKESVKILSLF